MQDTNIMTYYWTNTGINDRVIARSYRVSDGWNFDIGSRFDNINPVSGLHSFFEQEHCYCAKKSEVAYQVKKLKKAYKNIRIEQLPYR